jgi:hypothetical protein
MKKSFLAIFILLITFSCDKDDNVSSEIEIPDNYVNGIVEIPTNYNSTDIQVLSNGERFEVSEDGSFNIPSSDIIYAVNKNTEEVIFFTYVSDNLAGRSSNGNLNPNYTLNAEETALSLGISFFSISSYYPTASNYEAEITALKILIRQSGVFDSLVEAIQENVEGFISITAIQELIDLYNDFYECGGQIFEVLNDTSDLDEATIQQSTPNSDVPYIEYTSSPNGTLKVNLDNSQFNTETNKWDIDVTLFNSTPMYLGMTLGSGTDNTGYTFDSENLENVIKPYNASEFNKGFTDCSTQTNWLIDFKHLCKGEFTEFINSTNFYTENSFSFSLDNSNNKLIVFSPQQSNRLKLLNITQVIIKQMGAIKKMFSIVSDAPDDENNLIKELTNDFVEDIISKDEIQSKLLTFTNQATRENFKSLIVEIAIEFRKFVVENQVDSIKDKIKELALKKLNKPLSALTNGLLSELKFYEKIISITASELDIYMAIDSWQKYNGGIAFECVLPNSGNVYQGDVTLSTQQEVEDFGINEYTIIQGDLNIGTQTNYSITDLSFLHSLVEITGVLSIKYNDALTSLNGLNNITSVGTLSLHSNDALINLNELNITEVNNNLYITGNNFLTNIDGLQNISTIPGSIGIWQNGDLINIDGLQSINYVGHNLELWVNDLINIDGLQNITSVGGYIDITDEYDLVNLNGLLNLVSIGSFLRIEDNSDLSDLCGIRPLLLNNGLNSSYIVNNNAYNPTLEDIIQGDCSQ